MFFLTNLLRESGQIWFVFLANPLKESGQNKNVGNLFCMWTRLFRKNDVGMMMMNAMVSGHDEKS